MTTTIIYRFSEADEATIRQAMRNAKDTTGTALIRIGAASIGCTLADFRGIELDWLEEEAACVEINRTPTELGHKGRGSHAR